MIDMYHKSNRRGIAETIQVVLPRMNEDMAALAHQSLDKLEAMSDVAFGAQRLYSIDEQSKQVKAPGAGAIQPPRPALFFARHTNPSRFDTLNVTVCGSAGIIRPDCSFVSIFLTYRLRRNQTNKEKRATLPFVGRVTSDSGENNNNTQIYS